MKTIVLLISCISLATLLSAQTTFRDLSLDEALSTAAAEGKAVFVDCYTSWCVPCKMMAENIFPQKELGDFMNEKFVCVKYDMEKDNGPAMASKYKVVVYPTFLLLHADGSAMHQMTGASRSATEFLEKVQSGMKTEGLTALYEAGSRDTDFLVDYIRTLEIANDRERARLVKEQLFGRLSDEEKMSDKYWFIFESELLSPSASEDAHFIIEHMDGFREAVNAETVNRKVVLIFENRLEDIIRGKDRTTTPEQLDREEKLFSSCNLPEAERIGSYFAIIRAMQSQDTDKLLALYQQVYPSLDDQKLAYLYFNPISGLNGRWNSQQRTALAALTGKLAEKTENAVLRESMNLFIRGFIE